MGLCLIIQMRACMWHREFNLSQWVDVARSVQGSGKGPIALRNAVETCSLPSRMGGRPAHMATVLALWRCPKWGLLLPMGSLG